MGKIYVPVFIGDRMCLMFSYVSNIYVSCQCYTNCAGHFILDAHASRPVACFYVYTIYIHRCDCKPMPTSTCEANAVLTFSTFNSARCTTSRCHNQLLCQISSVLRKNMRGVKIPQISWSFVTTTIWVEMIFINKGTHTFPKKSKYMCISECLFLTIDYWEYLSVSIIHHLISSVFQNNNHDTWQNHPFDLRKTDIYLAVSRGSTGEGQIPFHNSKLKRNQGPPSSNW